MFAAKYWCTAYGGHLNFVKLSDGWSYIAAKWFDDDEAALVMRKAQLATSIFHCQRGLVHIRSE